MTGCLDERRFRQVKADGIATTSPLERPFHALNVPGETLDRG
jgi:hypothetical protein